MEFLYMARYYTEKTLHCLLTISGHTHTATLQQSQHHACRGEVSARHSQRCQILIYYMIYVYYKL